MTTKLKDFISKVVVVEDEPSFLRFWDKILTELGVTDYELFSDASEAALMLEEVPVKLLISDVIMPNKNGYDLARIACRRNPACSIVLTTAYGTDLSRFELSKCAFHLLHKPYTDVTALKRFIVHLLDGDDSFDDISEDSFSENEDYPLVTEWKL